LVTIGFSKMNDQLENKSLFHPRNLCRMSIAPCQSKVLRKFRLCVSQRINGRVASPDVRDSSEKSLSNVRGHVADIARAYKL
jgi:hypothetical protein